MKSEPLQLNYEFSRVYKRGQRFYGKYVLLHIFKRDSRVYKGRVRIPDDINRIGVTASKKVRTAVLRNRMRRLLRESYRTHEPFIKTGYDMILMIRDPEAVPTFSLLHEDIKHLLRKAGVMERDAL